MEYLRIKTEASLKDEIWTVQVAFENLLWDKGVVLFKQPDFIKEYTDFLLSFAQDYRVLVQYGHFGADRPFLEWLAQHKIPYAISKYAFSHLGDWSCYLDDDSFEVLFEPPKDSLPDLIRTYAWRDLIALLVTDTSSPAVLHQISTILTVPNAASSRSDELLQICQWLILTNDDGETVVIKSKLKDADKIVENNLRHMRQALT